MGCAVLAFHQLLTVILKLFSRASRTEGGRTWEVPVAPGPLQPLKPTVAGPGLRCATSQPSGLIDEPARHADGPPVRSVCRSHTPRQRLTWRDGLRPAFSSRCAEEANGRPSALRPLSGGHRMSSGRVRTRGQRTRHSQSCSPRMSLPCTVLGSSDQTEVELEKEKGPWFLKAPCKPVWWETQERWELVLSSSCPAPVPSARTGDQQQPAHPVPAATVRRPSLHAAPWQLDFLACPPAPVPTRLAGDAAGTLSSHFWTPSSPVSVTTVPGLLPKISPLYWGRLCSSTVLCVNGHSRLFPRPRSLCPPTRPLPPAFRGSRGRWDSRGGQMCVCVSDHIIHPREM